MGTSRPLPLTFEIIHAVKKEIVKKLQDAFGDDLRECLLYGSCARGTAEYRSDVDILVLVQEDWLEENRKITRMLTTNCTMDDCTMPEPDIHTFGGTLEEKPNTVYWKIMKKESVSLYHKEVSKTDNV